MLLRIAPFVSPSSSKYTALELRTILTVVTEKNLACGRTAPMERFLHPREKETWECKRCLKSQFLIIMALISFKSPNSLECATCRNIKEFTTVEYITILIDKRNCGSKVASGICTFRLKLYRIRLLGRNQNMAIQIHTIRILVKMDIRVSYSLKTGEAGVCLLQISCAIRSSRSYE